MPAWLGSGVGALFRACRWLPLAVSSGWVGRKITSSYEDANPVLGIHPHDLITPQTLLLCTIPLGVGLQHEFVGWGHKHLVHSRSLGMRGQDPPAPGPEHSLMGQTNHRIPKSFVKGHFPDKSIIFFFFNFSFIEA